MYKYVPIHEGQLLVYSYNVLCTRNAKRKCNKKASETVSTTPGLHSLVNGMQIITTNTWNKTIQHNR